MKRYDLNILYETYEEFYNALNDSVASANLMFANQYSESVYSTFIASAIYNAFFSDEVLYPSFNSDNETAMTEIKEIFMKRLGYDVAVQFPYWKRKYDYVVKLLSDDDLSLLQTSKMTSSSQERVDNAGGVLQKSANTPTGVSLTPTDDTINIETEKTGDVDDTAQTTESKVETTGFVDKYTNYQGKTSTASKTSGSRQGEVLREGSIKELLDVLEKLPSSFADEITKKVSKHFNIVYTY